MQYIYSAIQKVCLCYCAIKGTVVEISSDPPLKNPQFPVIETTQVKIVNLQREKH